MSPLGFSDSPDPDFRATYLRHSLRVIRWNKSMATPDQLEESLAQGVQYGEYEPVLIEIFRLAGDGNQISVRSHGNQDRLHEAETALFSWAAQAGYTRVWIESAGAGFQDLVRCESPPPTEIHCPCCAMIYDWESPGFWNEIHENGFLEAQCPTCGTQLPQWTNVGEEIREAEAAKNAIEYLKDTFRLE